MFCVYCWKVTETENERIEELKEKLKEKSIVTTILKGECKECKNIKLDKKKIKIYEERPLLI